MVDGKLLDDLALKNGSDKASGPDNNSYTCLYAEYFRRHGFMNGDNREKVRHILEIGTNKGASLRTWAEFFPNARICGIDITRHYEIPELLDHPNIHTFLVDQGNRDDILDFAIAEQFLCNRDGFDIIIDDGSHDQAHQQISWGTLFGFLRPGGLYVIEDIITGENWWDGNLYNKSRIIPTRAIVQTLEQTGDFQSPVMLDTEREYILANYSYCEYRESPAIIYSQHHPQVAFIGKK